MLRFLFKILLFVYPFLVLLLVLFYSADGNADTTFVKVNGSKKANLILGTSVASQGVNPKEFLDGIKRFNFAFTQSHSPYGEVYLNAIKAKLDTFSKNQSFILEVSPWALSTNDSLPNPFIEEDWLLSEVPIAEWYTPIVYFTKYYQEPFINLLDTNTYEYLTKEGWLAITVPMDSISILKRTERKLAVYDKMRKMELSKRRFESLLNTISFLSEYGNVNLFRLPVSEDLRLIENQKFPEFNDRIQEVVCEFIDSKVQFVDIQYLESDIQFTDGNHIAKSSVPFVVSEIEKYLK